MTAYLGFYPPAELSMPPNQYSTDMSAMAWASTMTMLRDASPVSGINSVHGVIFVWTVSVGGATKGMFDSLLFERIITTPRTKALGFVLSTQTFTVEVWNAHMQTFSTMTSITVAGGGGTTVANPGGIPLLYAPDQSFIFTMTEPQDGAASIRDLVTFVFTEHTGADVLVTGSRLTPFSLDIDWGKGFVEQTEYQTTVLKAWSDMEQRIQGRTVPRPHCAFSVAAMNAQEASYLDALLWGWQHRIFGVPWWPDASYLASDLAAGSTSVPVTTTFRSYAAGGLVMLWNDFRRWEVMAITTLTGAVVNFASPTQNLWKAGTVVVPLSRGRLGQSVSADRPSNYLSGMQVVFECEVV